nr:GS-II=insecticidal N-acetylglucosamine-specific lectin {N-terminal} [Griffonia simplicifolia, seed, Peptide Partial, 25 aa] [Griffonia simplicifolia]
ADTICFTYTNFGLDVSDLTLQGAAK